MSAKDRRGKLFFPFTLTPGYNHRGYSQFYSYSITRQFPEQFWLTRQEQNTVLRVFRISSFPIKVTMGRFFVIQIEDMVSSQKRQQHKSGPEGRRWSRRNSGDRHAIYLHIHVRYPSAAASCKIVGGCLCLQCSQLVGSGHMYKKTGSIINLLVQVQLFFCAYWLIHRIMLPSPMALSSKSEQHMAFRWAERGSKN